MYYDCVPVLKCRVNLCPRFFCSIHIFYVHRDIQYFSNLRVNLTEGRILIDHMIIEIQGWLVIPYDVYKSRRVKSLPRWCAFAFLCCVEQLSCDDYCVTQPTRLIT